VEVSGVEVRGGRGVPSLGRDGRKRDKIWPGTRRNIVECKREAFFELDRRSMRSSFGQQLGGKKLGPLLKNRRSQARWVGRPRGRDEYNSSNEKMITVNFIMVRGRGGGMAGSSCFF